MKVSAQRCTTLQNMQMNTRLRNDFHDSFILKYPDMSKKRFTPMMANESTICKRFGGGNFRLYTMTNEMMYQYQEHREYT